MVGEDGGELHFGAERGGEGEGGAEGESEKGEAAEAHGKRDGSYRTDGSDGRKSGKVNSGAGGSMRSRASLRNGGRLGRVEEGVELGGELGADAFDLGERLGCRGA